MKSRRNIEQISPKLKLILDLLRELPYGRLSRIPKDGDDVKRNREWIKDFRCESFDDYSKILQAAGGLFDFSPQRELGEHSPLLPEDSQLEHDIFVMVALRGLLDTRRLLTSLVRLRDEEASYYEKLFRLDVKQVGGSDSGVAVEPSIPLSEFEESALKISELKKAVKDTLEIKIDSDGRVQIGIGIFRFFEDLNISRLRICAVCDSLFWAYRANSQTCSSRHANVFRVYKSRKKAKNRVQRT